jgi:hypothetical protein
MRHGMQSSTSEEAGSSSVPDCSQKNIPGHQLGCYFCNDVVAPRNVSFFFLFFSNYSKI